MKLKWKIILGVTGLLLIAGGIAGGIQYSKRGIVTVQTGRIVRQDLDSVVTASGEIKPRNYINVGANAMGVLTALLVKEGDRVHRGQLLARLESVQPQAEVNAQKAAVSSTQADSAAAEAALRSADDNVLTLQAGLDRTKAEVERTRLDFDRARQLYESKLIARQEFDQKKAAHDSQLATVREAEARIVQARASRAQTLAQLTAAQRRIAQTQASLTRVSDVLAKHNSVAPIDGVVTNLPVRVGETVVMGIQNSPGSLIMTIADMSVITAEVKVDETEIVNIALDQPVDVKIEAIPDRTFKGKVIEIGNTAILRSTGLAASQSNISSQEAKDFKVVVALTNPPEEIRPGLSCQAKIITASKKNVVTVPAQALTTRKRADLEPLPEKNAQPKIYTPAQEKVRREELVGVFVIAGEKVAFREVKTGISGATDTEILSGLKEGEEVVTGSYKVVRTIRPDTKIKIDNKPPAPPPTT